MRGVLMVAVSLIVVGLSGPRGLAAQTTRADTAAVLVRVAEDLRASGHVEDARYVLRVVVERYGGTPAAGEAGRLLAEIRSRGEGAAGTAEFVGWHTALGAVVGLLVPAALDANDPEPFGVGLLLGGPLGYGLSRAYTTRHELSPGQALAIDYASVWGLIQFPMWEDILDIGAHEECFGTGVDRFCFEAGGDASSAGALLGALTGVAVGIAVAGNRPVTSSTALSMIFASQWGLYFGFVGSTLAQADGEGALAWTAVGGNLGLVAAMVGAPRLRWSTSRTWLVEASGLAGLAGGFGLALIANPDDDETAFTITALGAGLGLAIGAATTGSRDDSGFDDAGVGLSLLDHRPDGWRVGVPLPRPGMVAAPPGSRRSYVPALQFSILKAVF